MAGIIYANYYLPKTQLPVTEFLKYSKYKYARDEDFWECFISQSHQDRINIEEEKNELQMLDLLIADFFSKSAITPEEISRIIYTSPDNWVRDDIYIPYYLQMKHNMDSASITGMVQECVTTLEAMQLAAALVDCGQAEKVMILSVCYGRTMEERYTGSTVVGDGASILIIGDKNEIGEIIDGRSLSDGRYSYLKHNNQPPKISGLEIAKKGAEFIETFLNSNSLTLNDISLIIPQNINYSEYHIYSQYLNVSLEKYYIKNIANGGHLAEVDTVRNITDAFNEGQLQNAGKVLLFGSGTIGDGMDAVYNVALLQTTGKE